MFKFNRIFQEEAGGEGGAGGGAGGEGDPGAGGGEGGAQVWQYAEGVNGEGDRPDYFMDKFTNMSEQAKAYKQLEGRFGSFTGAPEEYAAVENSNAYVQAAIQNLGKDLNLNAEGYEKLVNEISTAVAGAEEAEYQKKLENAAQNIPNFERRQQQLSAAVVNILTPEQFKSLDSAVVTPEGFAAVEALISASQGVLPGITTPTSVDTDESLRKEMRALDPADVNGRTDLVKKMNKLHGDGEGKLV